jgi:hypothetical protein
MRLDEAAAYDLPVQMWHGSDWSDAVRITRHVITGTDQGVKRSLKLSNGLSLALAFCDENAPLVVRPVDISIPTRRCYRRGTAGTDAADSCAYLQGVASGASFASSSSTSNVVTKAFDTDDVHPGYAALRRSASRERRLSSEMRRSLACKTVIETFACNNNQSRTSSRDGSTDFCVPVDHASLHTRLRWLEGVADTVGTTVVNGGGCRRLRLDLQEGMQRAALVHLLHTLGVQPRVAQDDDSRALWIQTAGLALLTELGFKPKRVDVAVSDAGSDPDRRPTLEVLESGEVVPLLPGEVVYAVPVGTCPGKQVVINGAAIAVAN